MELDKLVARLEADISDFKSGMNEAVGEATNAQSRVSGSFNKIRGGIGSVSSAVFSLKGAFAGLGLGAVGSQFLGAADTTEQLQVRLRTLLGSVDEGKKVFQDMSSYAAQVPHDFESIMGAATRLGTVVKGGSSDISKYMPMIGDLAAAFGITIGEAADQFSRAMASGVGAADIFRDRGVTAMLGFKSGVASTGEDFVKTFEEAFNKTDSKFRGASAELANTWSGTMSMLGDKWFQFRNVIMEAGIFDWLKGFAKEIDKSFGGALGDSKDKAKGWAETILSGFEGIIRGVGYLVTGFQGLSIIWDTLKMGFEGFKLLILTGIEAIIAPINKIKTAFGGEPIDGGAISLWVDDTKENIKGLQESMHETAMSPTGLEEADELIDRIRKNMASAAESRAAMEASSGGEATGGEGGGATEVEGGFTAMEIDNTAYQERLAEKFMLLDESLMSEEERMQESYDNRQMLIEEAFQNGLITEQNKNEMTEALANQHQQAMAAIDQKTFKSRMASAQTLFSNLLTLTAGKSRSLFEVAKAGAIASAIINTYKAASNAFATAPWPFNYIAAGAAITSGLVQVQQIRSQSFSGGGGGGGGIGSAPTGGGSGVGGAVAAATPSTPVAGPTSTGGFAGAPTDITIDLGDDDALIPARSIRAIMEGINEQISDGASITGISIA